MTPVPVIVAKDLTKKFGDFTDVNGISFDINEGECFGFLGPNGAGKTTTIKLLLGLARPTGGSTAFRMRDGLRKELRFCSIVDRLVFAMPCR